MPDVPTDNTQPPTQQVTPDEPQPQILEVLANKAAQPMPAVPAIKAAQPLPEMPADKPQLSSEQPYIFALVKAIKAQDLKHKIVYGILSFEGILALFAFQSLTIAQTGLACSGLSIAVGFIGLLNKSTRPLGVAALLVGLFLSWIFGAAVLTAQTINSAS